MNESYTENWEQAIVDNSCSLITIPSHEILKALHLSMAIDFNQLIDIFACDYPNSPKRFEVNYLLLNMSKHKRIQFKLYVPVGASVPSACRDFPCAGWLEREVHEMYGISFDGNSDLRNILLDYSFEGHPMRKDFPLSGHKEVRYDIDSKKVEYVDVDLEQEYRDFNFISPWKSE